MYKSGFIAKAACHGHRPTSFASFNGFQRPHLIARMVRERAVARVIVAPSGYGKTSLALDYAETVFGWAHVFWLNGQSPCFIRDLDSGAIAAGVLETDEEAALVVVEDAPALDAVRTEALSRELDVLLESGCEVVVTCSPSSGALGAALSDRLRLGPEDLLLTDAELDSVRPVDDRNRRPSAFLPASHRVAALCWDGGDEARAAFAAGCLGEDLPADLLLAIGSALVLGSGTMSELSDACCTDMSSLADALSAYPHLGLDFASGRFEAPLLGIADMQRAIRRRIDAMADRSGFDGPDELVGAWARILLAQETGAERACDVIRLLYPSSLRCGWLERHEQDLVRFGCFLPCLHLIKSLRNARAEGKMLVKGLEALCYQLLGDTEQALSCAKWNAFHGAADGAPRVESLLVIARLGTGELRESALSALADIAGKWPDGKLAQAPWWAQLARAGVEREEGLERLAEFWARLRAEGAGDDVLCRVASWMFTLVASQLQGASHDGRPLLADVPVFPEVERYVRGQLEVPMGPAIDFYKASAGLSMEQAHAEGMPFAQGPLGTSVLLELRRVEMAVLAQRGRYEREKREQLAAASVSEKSPFLSLADGNPAPSRTDQRVIPVLEVCLFGRFSVTIGGEEVDPARFTRKHVRLLLALLAVARGREVSRDSLAAQMWPDSSADLARRNFYSAWAKLRRALMLTDGSCPYLERHDCSCRLVDRHVRSDIARLADICRELTFGAPGGQRWLDLYAEIDRDFFCELLPAEGEGTSLDQVRVEWRERLVDALVAASMRLVEDGQPQWGILFARAATERDDTREDAYVALMRAQAAHDQRTAAMMTYLKCRRILSERLGIDPSAETSALYETLLSAGS